MMYRIIGVDSQEYGPVSADEVRRWIAERRLHPGSLARAEGAADWKPLSQFPEFSTAFGVPASFSPASAAPPTNTLATVGLVLSCLGLVCCGCTPFAVLGIVFSGIGWSQAGRDPAQTGRGVAIAGLIVGIIALGESVLAFAFGVFGSVFQSLMR